MTSSNFVSVFVDIGMNSRTFEDALLDSTGPSVGNIFKREIQQTIEDNTNSLRKALRGLLRHKDRKLCEEIIKESRDQVTMPLPMATAASPPTPPPFVTDRE